MSNLVLTPLATDNFTPNANPLNPAKWTTFTDDDNLQALSGSAEGTAAGTSGAYYIGISTPNNQYVTITFTRWVLGNGGLAILDVRSDHSGENCYYLIIEDNQDGVTATISFGVVINDSGGTNFFLNESEIVAQGDTFTLAASNQQIVAYHNGSPVASAIDTTFASGVAGIELFYQDNPTDVTAGSFIIGTATGGETAGGNSPIGTNAFKFNFGF